MSRGEREEKAAGRRSGTWKRRRRKSRSSLVIPSFSTSQLHLPHLPFASLAFCPILRLALDHTPRSPVLFLPYSPFPALPFLPSRFSSSFLVFD